MRKALGLSVVAGALALPGALAADEPKKEQPPATATATGSTGAATPAQATAKVAAISDRDLALYPGSLFEVPNPAGFTWNASSPGENERLPRAYPIAPPRIPHGIADFLPITLTSNGCLDCHAKDAGADAPELPPSHRTDLRNTPDVVGTAVAGARYLCITCHVPTSDAKPARTNRLPVP